MQETELRKEITTIKTKYEETLAKHNETNEIINEYTETINTDKKASTLLNDELIQSQNTLGKSNVYGEGIIVTLTDVEVGKFGKVTASDLLELVNELKSAEVCIWKISENGQKSRRSDGTAGTVSAQQ